MTSESIRQIEAIAIFSSVIPAKAGIQVGGTSKVARNRRAARNLDPGFRRDDEWGVVRA